MRFFILFFLGSFISFAQGILVDSIAIEGNKKSKERYLRKLILTQQGTPYDSLSVQKDIIRIIREPAISHAYYELENTQKGNYKLTYFIEENTTLIPALDIWSTLNNKTAYHLGVNEYNFLGKGYLVGLFYRKNIFDGFGLILGNQNFIKPFYGINFILQSRNTFEPVGNQEGLGFYNYKLLSSDLEFKYKPTVEHNYSLGIGLLRETYEFEEGIKLINAPDYFTADKFILKLGHDYNVIEQYYYFFFGLRNQVNVSMAWGENFGGENSFYSINNITTYFLKSKGKGNWGSRLLLGVSKNFETPFPVFVLDNNLNLRGVGNKIARGSAIAVFNTEYRYTLLEKKWLAIQGNGFIDYASLLPAGAKKNELFQKDNSHLYGGIGVRFIHKFIHSATLRIDYGFSLKDPSKRGIVFGIGQYF